MTIPMTDAVSLDLEKTAMARCARRSPFRSWPAWLYFGVFLISFSVFYIFWCTNSWHNYMLSQLTLRNGTHTMSMWENPPAKINFEIYVFNYTNVEDFLKYRADKLHVEEIGPFRYVETKKRVNIKQGDQDDWWTYQEEMSYEWVGGRSEDEVIVVPNLPILSSISYVRDMNIAAQLSLTAVLTSLKEKPFIRERAGGVFWGYDDQFFRIVKPLLSLTQEVPFEKFGIFAMKKGVNKDRITINAGTRDIKKLGLVEKLNGLSSRNVWGDERCDKITGTDGTLFPPHLMDNNTNTLHIFSKELCRSLNFQFSEYVTQYIVPAWRYKLDRELLLSTKEEDKCFCRKKGHRRVCPRKGLVDISVCTNGSPLIMSLPHFWEADKSLLQQIDGLHPRAENHESYLDLYPGFAIPMAGWSRLQINMEVQKAFGVPLLGRIPDGMVLPIVWISSGVNQEDLPQKILDILYRLHHTVRAVVAILEWSSLVGMILSMGALLVCFKKYRMEHPDVGLQMNSVDQNKLLEVS